MAQLSLEKVSAFHFNRDKTDRALSREKFLHRSCKRMRFKSHGNFHSLNTATFACIPPFFYSSRSVWKHQRWSEILFFSLSLVVGSRAISLSAYSCTHMHRSWMRTAFLASWQCARASAYLDYKPFILPFLFLPPFSSQSRRFISTLIRCAAKSLHPRIGFFLRVQLVFFTLEIIRDGLFDVTFRHYYIIYIDWYFRCRFFIETENELITLSN